MEEINALKNLGCSEVAAAEEAKQHRVYRALFFEYLKSNSTKRLRLCVAKTMIITMGYLSQPQRSREYPFAFI